MPITGTDIVFRLSGGASNATTDASLGGVISSTVLVDATVANLFDNVTGDESAAGDTEYRCFYVRNSHATLTWLGVKVWISSQSTSPDTDVAIGADPAAVGNGTTTGVATTTANESTAPAGVTFSAPANKVGAITLGDIPPLNAQAIWVKRNVSAGAAAFDADTTVFRVEGDTGA
jgi:hypothetical protein